MKVEDLDNYFGHKPTERNVVLNIKDIKLNKNTKSQSVLVLGNERKENIKETISLEKSSRDKKMNNNSLNFIVKPISSSSSNMKENSKKYHLPIFDDDKSSEKNTNEIKFVKYVKKN